MEADRAQYSVWMWLCDGSHHDEARWVDISTAVRIAGGIAGSVGGRIGVVERVIITDGGDCIVWEWTHADGIIYPPPSGK